MRILIIDKYPVIRLGLSFEINAHFSSIIIHESENFNPPQENKSDSETDLIILGLNQEPDINYLKVIVRLKSCYARARLILYDEHPGPPMLIQYFQAGANGYLPKQNGIDELLHCIAEVIKGKRYISNELLLEALLHKQFFGKSVPYKQSIYLTSHQYEIANYLIMGMKTSWIARKMGRKMSTISTTKSNIFKKLDVDNIEKLKDAVNLLYFKM